MVKINNQEGLFQNQMTSGLSLTEIMLYASWMSEQEIGDRELKEPHYYYEKLQEIKANLQEEINQGKNAEGIIKKFIGNKTELLVQETAKEQMDLFIKNKLKEYRQQHKNNSDKLTEDMKKKIIQQVETEINDDLYTKEIFENCEKELNRENKNTSYLTYVLESNNINCVGDTSLFLSLAEMLDQELFENCYIGILPASVESSGHVMIRKKSNEGYENIDFGKIIPDEWYLEELDMFPETKPKKNIVIDILYNCGNNLTEKGLYAQALKYFNKALKIDPTYSSVKLNKEVVLRKIEERQHYPKTYCDLQKVTERQDNKDPSYDIMNYNNPVSYKL